MCREKPTTQGELLCSSNAADLPQDVVVDHWNPEDKYHYYFALNTWCAKEGKDADDYTTIDTSPWCGVRFFCARCRKYDSRDCYCLNDKMRRVWSISQGAIMKFDHTKAVPKPTTDG